MKKILLTLMCVVISTLSFSQKNLDKGNLKISSVKAVDYMNKTLKLNEKQKAIFMSAYAEYAANMRFNVLSLGKIENNEFSEFIDIGYSNMAGMYVKYIDPLLIQLV